MAKAIRVSDGNRWVYVPAGSEHQARLERFASAGLAEIANGIVLLKSEAGPLFWEMLNKLEKSRSDKLAILEKVDSDSINIEPDEQLSFGKKDDALAYSDFADLSLTRQSWTSGGIPLATRPIEEREIVMTLWPKKNILIPAKSSNAVRRIGLELVEPQEKGDRCFVLDDKCETLLTVSFASDGSDKVMAINPVVMDSWLLAAGSNAMMKMSGRFDVVHHAEGNFLIADSKTGKKYAGNFIFSPSDKENFDLEKSRLVRLLASTGLGAILPTYGLKKA